MLAYQYFPHIVPSKNTVTSSFLLEQTKSFWCVHHIVLSWKCASNWGGIFTSLCLVQKASSKHSHMDPDSDRNLVMRGCHMKTCSHVLRQLQATKRKLINTWKTDCRLKWPKVRNTQMTLCNSSGGRVDLIFPRSHSWIQLVLRT